MTPIAITQNAFLLTFTQNDKMIFIDICSGLTGGFITVTMSKSPDGQWTPVGRFC